LFSKNPTVIATGFVAQVFNDMIIAISLETSMTMVRKTITLPQGLDDWIKSRIVKGDYSSDSEYIRDLLRRDRETAEADLFQMLDESEAHRR
jgi:putative addiction module CopG family antidote